MDPGIIPPVPGHLEKLLANNAPIKPGETKSVTVSGREAHRLYHEFKLAIEGLPQKELSRKQLNNLERIFYSMLNPSNPNYPKTTHDFLQNIQILREVIDENPNLNENIRTSLYYIADNLQNLCQNPNQRDNDLLVENMQSLFDKATEKYPDLKSIKLGTEETTMENIDRLFAHILANPLKTATTPEEEKSFFAFLACMFLVIFCFGAFGPAFGVVSQYVLADKIAKNLPGEPTA